MAKRNKHAGSSLDDFLKEEGVFEETRASALKDAFAWRVQHPMAKQNITDVEMTDRTEG
jgi:antitoxin HicB